MREFLKSLRFKILLGVLAVLLGMMIYAAGSGGIDTLPERIFASIVTPVTKFTTTITDGFADFFSVFFNAKNNYEENLLLKEENAKLKQQLADYGTIKTENERFKEILNITELDADIELIDAGVISRDPTDSFYGFNLDRGSAHGVSLRDPVVTADGLVGFISSVGPTYSTVTTLFNPQSNVGALDSVSRETGNVTGTIELAKENLVKMEFLSTETAIQEGNLIVTSGSSGMFPADLVIGEAKEIVTEDSGISLSAYIEPAADITKTKYVYILTSFLGQSSEEEAP